MVKSGRFCAGTLISYSLDPISGFGRNNKDLTKPHKKSRCPYKDSPYQLSILMTMSFFGSVTDWKSKSLGILSIAMLISQVSSGTKAGKGSVSKISCDLAQLRTE